MCPDAIGRGRRRHRGRCGGTATPSAALAAHAANVLVGSPGGASEASEASMLDALSKPKEEAAPASSRTLAASRGGDSTARRLARASARSSAISAAASTGGKATSPADAAGHSH